MLELQGVVRRAGAGVCTLTLVGLCLGATAPAGFADERGKHGGSSKQGESSKHGERAQAHAHQRDAASMTHVTAKPAKKGKAKPHKAAKPAKARHREEKDAEALALARRAEKPLKHGRVKLHDLLLPGALGDTTTTDPLVRRPSAIVVVPVVVPAVVPAAAAPDASAPVVSVVVKKAAKARARKAERPTVSAEALLDVTTVSPTAARSVLAPRRLAITLVQNPVGRVAGARAGLVRTGSARAGSAVTRVAAPSQLVDRTAPRFDAWPTRPIALPSAPADVPMSVALGGLVLALAAARGVARMRHPSTDDPDLSFPTA